MDAFSFWQSAAAMDRTKNRNEPISPYAVDPFVALPTGHGREVADRAQKSIEEILESLNGYQLPVQHNLAETESDSDSSSDPSYQNALEQKFQTSLGTKDMNQTHSKPPEFGPMTAIQPDVTARLDERLDEIETLEFDVRNFSRLEEVEAEVEVGAPQPIRSGFDVDQDFFDYAAIEARIDRDEGLQSGMPAVVAPKHSEQELPKEIFWAGPDDVIYIDGKEGYSFIDLACFDISSASFEANQIRIQMDQDSTFQVDYRNVTHAVFAGGVEIELAANEIGFFPN